MQTLKVTLKVFAEKVLKAKVKSTKMLTVTFLLQNTIFNNYQLHTISVKFSAHITWASNMRCRRLPVFHVYEKK